MQNTAIDQKSDRPVIVVNDGDRAANLLSRDLRYGIE